MEHTEAQNNTERLRVYIWLSQFVLCPIVTNIVKAQQIGFFNVTEVSFLIAMHCSFLSPVFISLTVFCFYSKL